MKLKILQFTVAASKGGRTQYILNLWRNIDKSRFQFDFVTFSPKLDFESELLTEGCKIHYLSCHPEKDEKKFIKEFSNVLKNELPNYHKFRQRRFRAKSRKTFNVIGLLLQRQYWQ